MKERLRFGYAGAAFPACYADERRRYGRGGRAGPLRPGPRSGPARPGGCYLRPSVRSLGGGGTDFQAGKTVPGFQPRGKNTKDRRESALRCRGRPSAGGSPGHPGRPLLHRMEKRARRRAVGPGSGKASRGGGGMRERLRIGYGGAAFPACYVGERDRFGRAVAGWGELVAESGCELGAAAGRVRRGPGRGWGLPDPGAVICAPLLASWEEAT